MAGLGGIQENWRGFKRKTVRRKQKKLREVKREQKNNVLRKII
jgi:hypothetical protein